MVYLQNFESEQLDAMYRPPESEDESLDTRSEEPGNERTIDSRVDASISNNERLLRAIRRYPKMTCYVIGLVSIFLLGGYDSVIVTSVSSVPQFQKDYGQRNGGDKIDYIIPSMWLSLWGAFDSLGTIIGAFLAGPWQDRVGRRWPLLVGSFLSAVAVAIDCVSSLPGEVQARRSVFLVGHIVQGIGIGLAQTTAQTYISENVPTSLRGSAMALVPTLILFGQLVGAIVTFMMSDETSNNAYMATFYSMLPFSAIACTVALLVPESPAYLVRKENLSGAYRMLLKLHTHKIDCGKIVKELQQSIEQEKQLSFRVSYRDCFVNSNRRRTFISVFATAIPMLFGLSILSNASYFLQVVGMEADDSMIILVLGIAVGLVANGVGVFLASHLGRRLLTLTTLSITTVLWLSMGIAGCFSGIVTAWYSAATMICVITFCGVGAWPASYAIIGEASSLRLRAKTLAIATFVRDLLSIVFSLVLPYLYNADAGNLGAKLGFVYFAFCFLAVCGTWWAVPEMKGRTSAEIDSMFRLGLPARKFEKWSSEIKMDETVNIIDHGE